MHVPALDARALWIRVAAPVCRQLDLFVQTFTPDAPSVMSNVSAVLSFFAPSIFYCCSRLVQ